MNMKNICLWAASLLVMLAACNEEKEASMPVGPAEDYPAEIHGAIKDYAPLGTTRAEKETAIWVEGAAIGVTTAAGMSNISYVRTDDRNVKYVYNAGKGTFEVVSKEGEDHTIYFKGPYTMSMTAYAPYTGERGTLPGVIKATTSSEMQTAAAQSAIDFLYAEGGGSQRTPRVDFRFFHRMSRLVLSFKTEAGVEAGDITYKLKNIMLDGTFDTTSGMVVTDEKVEKGDISMRIAKADVLASSLILFPQTLTKASVLEVEMGGKSYAVSFEEETKMTSGSVYTFNVTIAPQGMTISPVVIEDWGLGDDNSHYVIAN